MTRDATASVRLQKLIAAAGRASRRAAEDLLRAGRVAVNGKPAALGDSADPDRDVVTVDGEPLALERRAYWVVNKPRGVLTSVGDPRGRRTVMDLLPPDAPRMFPVGRLDLDTEGLLLFTNDGDLAHRLLHPSFGVEREYQVEVRGRLGRVAARQLAEGVPLADGVTAPARVERVHYDRAGHTTRLTLTLCEGRKRQIRRSLRALGHEVIALRRVRMGTQRLGRLAAGAARPLSAGERRALRALAERR